MSIMHFATTTTGGLILRGTSGVNGTVTGYSTFAAIGTLDPKILKGELISILSTNSSGTDVLTFLLEGAQVPQDFFQSLNIVGEDTFLTADADSYNQGGGDTQWNWNNPGFLFPNSGSFIAVVR